MFIKKIEKYFNGEMKEEQAFQFWVDVVADLEKFEDLQTYHQLRLLSRTKQSQTAV